MNLFTKFFTGAFVLLIVGVISLSANEVYAASPSISSNPATFSGLKKIQAFTIGPNVTPGDVFTFGVRSKSISVTAESGDTPKSIAIDLSSTINGANLVGIDSYTYSDLPNTFSVVGLITDSFSAYAVGSTSTNTTTTAPTITDSITITVIPVSTTTHTIYTSAGSNGYISPTSRVVNDGSKTTFKIIPDSGYSINGVTGCNGSLSGSTYTTGVITSGCTVNATFSFSTMSGTLTSSSSSCTIRLGESTCNVNLSWSITNPVATPTAITASGMSNINVSNSLLSPQVGLQSKVVVPYNPRTFFPARTFNLYNNAIELASVSVSSSCASGSVWNGSVCAMNDLTVSTSSGYGGSISPTSQTVSYGSSTSFDIMPEPSYSLGTVVGCNGSLSNSSSGGYIYTTGKITSNCTVSAIFNPTITHTVYTLAGAGGTISPISRMVDEGDDTTFTITPDSGYSIDSVSGCGGSLSDSTYKTGPITSNCAVNATFSSSSTTMSGTLSPTSSSSCPISEGNSSCNLNLTWGITNPTATPTAITASGMSNINVTNTLASPQSGTRTVTVPYNSRTFYLYNNAVELASTSLSSSCTSGTGWDSDTSTCLVGGGDVDKGGDVDGYWFWGDWSECSVGCDEVGGITTRTGVCIPPVGNGAPCFGPDTQTKSCSSSCTPGGGNTLNIEFNVNPIKIFKGSSVFLTWSSVANSCTGIGFNTQDKANKTDLPVILTPLETTSYTLSCTGLGITEEETIEVKVIPINVIES